MRRRALLAALLGLAASAAPAQTGRQARVGFIGNDPVGGGDWARVLWGRLGELGWREGHNLAIDAHWVYGDLARAAAAAATLVAARVDLIVAINAIYVEATRRLTTTIPIVFVTHGDPLGTGHVASLARPGGNITGVTHMQPEVTAKGLEVLRDAAPGARRIAVLWSPEAPPHHNVVPLVVETARRLGIAAVPVPARFGDSMADVLAQARRERAEALLILQAPVFSPHYALLARLARDAGWPSLSTFDRFAHLGGLVGFGADFVELHRRAAVYVDKILRGARPADLPVEQASKFNLAVNLTTAKALGLTIPPSILARADEVIE